MYSSCISEITGSLTKFGFGDFLLENWPLTESMYCNFPGSRRDKLGKNYPEGILCVNEIEYADLEIAVIVIWGEYGNTGSFHHMNTHNAYGYAKKWGSKSFIIKLKLYIEVHRL